MFGTRLRELADCEEYPEPGTENEQAYRAKLESLFLPDLLAFADAMDKANDRDKMARAAARFLAWLVTELCKESEQEGRDFIMAKAMEQRAVIEAEAMRDAGIRTN